MKFFEERFLWDFFVGITHSLKSLNLLLKRLGLKNESIKPLYFDAIYVSILSEKNTNSLFWFIKGTIIGLWSNIYAFFNRKYSSIIYIIKT